MAKSHKQKSVTMVGQLPVLDRLVVVTPDPESRLIVVAVVPIVSVDIMRPHVGHMNRTVVIMMVVIGIDRHAPESATPVC